MKKFLWVFIWLILVGICGLLTVAIGLPIFSKFGFLKIFKNVGYERIFYIKNSETYEVYAHSSDIDLTNIKNLKAVVKVDGNEITYNQDDAGETLYGQELDSGKQIEAVNLLTFKASESGNAHIELIFPEDISIELALLVNYWKIPLVGTTIIIFSCLEALFLCWGIWYLAKKMRNSGKQDATKEQHRHL